MNRRSAADELAAMLTPHRAMLEDRTRCEAYRRAVHATVRPGDVVLDLGAGTGLLGYFAIQAGAARVYAIERSDVIHDARSIAQANGWDHKIVFLEESSLRMVLPEKVDVVVSELLGFLGLDESVIHYLRDAKARFLKDTGRMVPKDLELFLAPADDGDFYQSTTGFWSADLYGIDYRPGRREAVNTPAVTRTAPEKLLAEGKALRRFDLERLGPDEDLLLDRTLVFAIEKSGCLNGLVGWFHTELADGIGLGTSPLEPATHWKNSFLPLEQPLEVKRGDAVHVKVVARRLAGNTIWTWRADLAGGATIRTGSLQSSFHNLRLKSEVARHLADDSVPSRSDVDDARLFILQNCDGTNTMARLAEMVQARFPDRFPSQAHARSWVVDVTRRCRLADRG